MELNSKKNESAAYNKRFREMADIAKSGIKNIGDREFTTRIQERGRAREGKKPWVRLILSMK